MRYFILIITLIGLASCNGFLDKEPLASVPAGDYLLAESDLAAYSAGMYSVFPVHRGYNLGNFSIDNNSDNQTATSENPNFITGQVRVAQKGGEWNFETIRDCNYFLNTVLPRYKKGTLTGSDANIRHYIGEMYFFRAYIYFDKLVNLGDFPIVKSIVSEDYGSIKESSRRRPRNEVARFILDDLDSAYHYMKDIPPMTNRLTRDVATLMKSRVALFEGTWLNYHKGTARVPGGQEWPGEGKDYLSNYSIDIDAEISYFLGVAMETAGMIAEFVPLATDYAGMFNSLSLDDVEEVLLWKKYDASLIPAVNHFAVGYLQRDGGGNSGYTRSMVESFLMANGMPVYAAGSGYKGDVTITDVATGRDNRLIESMMIPGDLLTTEPVLTINNGYYFRPPIVTAAENRCTTGYSVKKGLVSDPKQGPTLPSSTACVIFRAAEAYLNYMEADYVKNGSLDANSRKYWKAIRNRAKVDDDFQKTINLTNLDKEPDFGKYSGDGMVDATLYNIRRERRCEFIAEGMRLRDLYRWRALDNMKGYIVEGFNLWDENYKLYAVETSNVKPELLIEYGNPGANVSASDDSKYLRPYRATRNNLAYKGYDFNQNHYLKPIAYDHFRLTTAVEGSGEVKTSVIYQNPGWKIEVGSSAGE